MVARVDKSLTRSNAEEKWLFAAVLGAPVAGWLELHGGEVTQHDAKRPEVGKAAQRLCHDLARALRQPGAAATDQIETHEAVGHGMVREHQGAGNVHERGR
jgi:hypothetical protein